MESRIKKLEDKINEFEEQQEELDSNIEDLYNTINEFKYPETLENTKSNEHLETHLDTHLDTHLETHSSKNTNENIVHFIDYIISLNPTKYPPYAKRQALSFINYINKDTLQSDTVNIDLQREQIKYFLELDDKLREKMLQQYQNINNLNISNKPKLFKILESSLSDYHKKLALSKLQNLEGMQSGDSEYFKLNQWLNNLLDIPFNQYKQPAFINQSPPEIFQTARGLLNNVIYGQTNTKQHILEIVARMISNPQAQGSVFAVEGEPGTGKTTLINHGLSKVLGLPFIFISLGGAQDSSYLAGENYTYIGSKCGKIIQSLKEAQCMNPIFYFDELDKVSTTERGQEIINLLIHITDFSQNNQFLDQYMDGISVDLSRAIFIFSFNDRNKVCPILLDRMEIIKFHSYSSNEKKYITEKYLLPSVIKQYFGNDNNMIIEIKNKKHILNKIIATSAISSTKSKYKLDSKLNSKLNSKYNYNIKNIFRKSCSVFKVKNRISIKNRISNGGVRYIKRRLETIISRINIERLENDSGDNDKTNDKTNKIIIDNKLVNKLL